jgi:ribosome maturation factor RimP
MKEIIEKIIKDKIEGTQAFLVEMVILKNKIEIYIDGDAGASLEDCALLNRHLHRSLEELNVDIGDFVVEISSPGLDRDIKELRAFKKNVGRNLRVRNSQNRYLTGKLAMVRAEGIILTPANQAKKSEFINYSEIQEAKAVI